MHPCMNPGLRGKVGGKSVEKIGLAQASRKGWRVSLAGGRNCQEGFATQPRTCFWTGVHQTLPAYFGARPSRKKTHSWKHCVILPERLYAFGIFLFVFAVLSLLVAFSSSGASGQHVRSTVAVRAPLPPIFWQAFLWQAVRASLPPIFW